MYLLDEKGIPQLKLKSGERIFSIPDTKKIIKLAKKAITDKDLIKLGSEVANMIYIQDTNEPEYVTE